MNHNLTIFTARSWLFMGSLQLKYTKLWNSLNSLLLYLCTCTFYFKLKKVMFYLSNENIYFYSKEYAKNSIAI